MSGAQLHSELSSTICSSKLLTSRGCTSQAPRNVLLRPWLAVTSSKDGAEALGPNTLVAERYNSACGTSVWQVMFLLPPHCMANSSSCSLLKSRGKTLGKILFPT